MKVQGERIIVFGDSLSHHGADQDPEIWDVDADSNRVSGQPGDLLASMLLEQGAQAVRVNARVGRSAHNFWGRENANALLSSDAAFQPTQVVIFLGTNDIGLNPEIDRADMQKIVDFYQGLGADVWAIGPVMYVDQNLNIQADAVSAWMSDLFGGKFVDPRPITPVIGRAGDGVHFGADSARQLATQLAQMLPDAIGISKTGWLGIAVGALFAGAIAYAVWHRSRRAQLDGYEHIPGGKAEGMEPEDFDPNQLKIGTRVEMEHTNDRRVAREIAMDHLAEDPDYYTKLSRVHLDGNEIDIDELNKLPIDARPRNLSPDINFDSLTRDADPAALEIAEDWLLKNGYKMREATGGMRARNFTIELNPMWWPKDEWKMVEANVFQHGPNRIWTKITLANGKERAYREYSFKIPRGKSDDEYKRNIAEAMDLGRKRAVATAWQVAKKIKPLPLDADYTTVFDILEETVVRGKANIKPDELFGHNVIDLGFAGIKVSTKDPATMTASQINQELDKLDAADSAIGDQLIAAGRGHETYNETIKAADPLAREFQRLANRRSDLRVEIHARYGPGAPRRLPTGERGFGPRKKPEPKESKEIKAKRKALQAEREQLMRAADYAGNTPEQVKIYHAKIEAINDEIKALG